MVFRGEEMSAGLMNFFLKKKGVLSHLPTPAHAQRSPLLDPGRLLLNLLQQTRHLLRRVGRAGGPREELAQPLLLRVSVGRDDVVGQVVAEEEVGHEDAVGPARVGGGEDVGALDRLRAEAEDVVDDEEGGAGGGGAGGVAFHVVG